MRAVGVVQGDGRARRGVPSARQKLREVPASLSTACMGHSAGQCASSGLEAARGGGSIGITRVMSLSGRLREYRVAIERTMRCVCVCMVPDMRLYACLACYVSVSGLVGLYASRAATRCVCMLNTSRTHIGSHLISSHRTVSALNASLHKK